MDAFVDAIDNIVETQAKGRRGNYFLDGSIEMACPPLAALLHVMTKGTWEGVGTADLKLRTLFTRESLLKSDWYAKRLRSQQEIDLHLWRRHVAYLEDLRCFRAPRQGDGGFEGSAGLSAKDAEGRRVSDIYLVGDRLYRRRSVRRKHVEGYKCILARACSFQVWRCIYRAVLPSFHYATASVGTCIISLMGGLPINTPNRGCIPYAESCSIITANPRQTPALAQGKKLNQTYILLRNRLQRRNYHDRQ